ncbi:MAG: YqiA/YcfP family alpha/beta fold hydrolase [Bradymonadia bacterium]
MPIFFAHGFEGSATGAKPTYLRERLGLDVVAPQMNADGLGFREQVQVVLDTLLQHTGITTLIGSSMGGLACAVAAEQMHQQGDERPLQLVLLAPAVGVHQTFARRLGPEAMALWKEQGTLPYPHAGLNKTVPLPWRLYTECEAASAVTVHHPCVVIHGKHDDVIAPTDVLQLALRSPGVMRMHLVDDDHRLLKSLAQMSEALRELAGISSQN